MKQELLDILRKITPEEERLRSGNHDIEKNLYSSADSEMDTIVRVDAAKLLEAGKLIQVRTHTRFVHFPVHTHNYVELVYMCHGSTHHVINGEDVILNEGELLFLNQKAQQEIYPASEEDIAVNFIILPEFFDYGLHLMGNDKNLLKDFVIDCLKGENQISGYLHFKVADVLPVQNLVENLLDTLMAHADKDHPTLVLDHQPYGVAEADALGVDLLFCGHTHRGQVWPLTWVTDKLFEQSHGYRQWSHAHVYVSQGLSLWGPPFRIGSSSEFVVFKIIRLKEFRK